jgi:hypothetical protein
LEVGSLVDGWMDAWMDVLWFECSHGCPQELIFQEESLVLKNYAKKLTTYIKG